MFLLNALHELAARTREIMAVHIRSVQHSCVTLSLFFPVTLDFVNDVVKVKTAHILFKHVNLNGWPSVKELGTTDVDECAVGETADATPAIGTLNNFFMTEDRPFP